MTDLTNTICDLAGRVSEGGKGRRYMRHKHTNGHNIQIGPVHNDAYTLLTHTTDGGLLSREPTSLERRGDLRLSQEKEHTYAFISAYTVHQ